MINLGLKPCHQTLTSDHRWRDLHTKDQAERVVVSQSLQKKQAEKKNTEKKKSKQTQNAPAHLASFPVQLQTPE